MAHVHISLKGKQSFDTSHIRQHRYKWDLVQGLTKCCGGSSWLTAMPLHQRPYCSACGFIICLIAWALIFPFYWSLNALFSCFFRTTKEVSTATEDSFCHRPLLTLCILLLVILCLVTLPLAVVGVLLWLPCQSCRHSYIFSHDPGIDIRQLHTDDMLQEPFVVASANVCLLPEAIARLHNLADTNKRASKIGNILSQTNSDLFRDESVFELKDSGNSSDLERPTNGVLYPCFQNVQTGKQQGEVFPLLVNKAAGTPQHTQATEGLGAAAADILNGISSHDEAMRMKDGARPHKEEDHLTVRSHPRELYQPQRADHSRKSSSQSTEGMPAASLMYRDINISIQPSRHSVAADSLQVHSPDDSHPGKDHRERSHSQSRSRTSSNRLSASASGESGIGSSSSNHRRCSTNRSARNSSSASSSFFSHEDIFCHFISDTFPPDLDFLCLQEVFDQRAGTNLIQKLHHQFPFIIYDVGNYGIKCRQQKIHLSLVNSGLLFASRFPIEDAVFRQFTNCTKQDYLSAKGLLMVKVRLRQRQSRSGGIVAFISNVHLQEGRECSALHKTQLNHIQDWLAEFRQQNGPLNEASSTGDRVAFDILCGDFNFDNESSADEECWSHSLMSHYQDPGRICQGKDKPWTVGTELTQQRIHDPEVNAPKGLRDVLTAGTKRGEYVESVIMNDETGAPPSEMPTNGKRRTDLILYNLETTQTNLNVEEYHFVTQLASLTDHLALAMKYHVSSR